MSPVAFCSLLILSDNATRVTFELESLPTWQNPTERKTQSSTLSINCQISSDEAKRLREVLEKKGLVCSMSTCALRC